MKKLLKNKIFWIIVAVILIIIGWAIFKAKQPAKEEYQTAQVERGSLSQTVSATGKVESASETNLNFRQTGTLAKLCIKAGDQVKQGQTLAELNSAGPGSTVVQARAALAQAQADLASLKAGSSKEEVSVTQAQVDQASANFTSAQANLTQTQEENNQKLHSLKEQALNKASESLFLAKSSLEDVNYIINSADYKDYFKVFGFTYTKATDSYDQGIINRDNLDKIIGQYSTASSIADLVGLLDQADTVLKAADSVLDISYDLLSKVAPGGNLSQTQIDTFKATITTDQAAVAAKIVVSQTAKSNLQTKSVEYDNTLHDAENNLVASRAALDIALAQLDLKKAGPRDFQLQQYQAKVDQQEANLNKALADLSDYSIKAPVNGIISKVNYKLGELVASTNPAISLVGESNLEIEVDVPESDVAKIKMGNEVKITLDAFGDEKVFLGHLTFIDPSSTIINDVVYYKVKVIFDQQEASVKPGMTANVIILANSRENVLYIPVRAVIEKDGQRIVRILQNGQKQEKQVTTGLRGDEGLIEILSGLEQGQTVITFIKNSQK